MNTMYNDQKPEQQGNQMQPDIESSEQNLLDIESDDSEVERIYLWLFQESIKAVDFESTIALETLVPMTSDLLRCCQSSDKQLQEQAAKALTRLGSRAIPGLIDALQDPEISVCIEACRSLAKLGSQARAAVPALREVLEDETEEVRDSAIQAFKEILEPVETISDASALAISRIERLTPAQPRARWRVRLDGSIGPRLKLALAACLLLAAGGLVFRGFGVDPGADRPTRGVLHNIANNESVAVLLSSALQDPTETVRSRASHALKSRVDTLNAGELQHVVSTFVAALERKDWKLRYEAVEFLGSLGPKASSAVPALLEVQNHDLEEEVRLKAAWALDRIRS